MVAEVDADYMTFMDINTCFCDDGHLRVYSGDAVVLPTRFRWRWIEAHTKGNMMQRLLHRLECDGWHSIECPECAGRKRLRICPHTAMALREAKRDMLGPIGTRC